MNELIPPDAISPLRQRLVDDMTMGRFDHDTQRNYLRDVWLFATWLGRSPHIATAEDVRRFQMSSRKRAYRRRPLTALSRRCGCSSAKRSTARSSPASWCTVHARKIPVVLTLAEANRLLEATTCFALRPGNRTNRSRLEFRTP